MLAFESAAHPDLLSESFQQNSAQMSQENSQNLVNFTLINNVPIQVEQRGSGYVARSLRLTIISVPNMRSPKNLPENISSTLCVDLTITDDDACYTGATATMGRASPIRGMLSNRPGLGLSLHFLGRDKMIKKYSNIHLKCSNYRNYCL